MKAEPKNYAAVPRQRTCKDTLIKYVNRLSCKTMERLDEEVILALASSGEEHGELLEYIERFSGRDLSDLDIAVILAFARTIAKRAKGTDYVSG